MAQNDFRPGYVITNEQDTLHGSINYRIDSKNATVCVFKKTNQSESVTYTPHQLKGFRFINDKFYVSKEIDTKNGKEKLFLEFLVNGIVSVYYYDDGNDHYLIDESNNQLKELTQETRKIYKGETLYTYEHKAYKGLLKNSFKQSPTVSKAVDHLSLSHKSLITIARNYHEEVCEGEKCITYEKRLPEAPLVIGLLVGLTASSLTYDTSPLVGGAYYVDEIDLGTQYYPSVGIYLKKDLPFVSERLSIQYEISYATNVKLQGTAVKREGNFTSQNDIRINWSALNNALLVKYELWKGKVIPQIGVCYDLILQSDYRSHWKTTSNATGNIVNERTAVGPFGTQLLGPTIGIGFRKKIQVDLRYRLLIIPLRVETLNQFSLIMNIPVLKYAWNK